MHFDHVGAGVKPATILTAAVIGLLVSVAVMTDMWFLLVLAVAGLLFVVFAFAYPRLALLVWLLLAPVANAYANVPLPVGLPDLTFGRVVIGVVTVGVLLRMILKGYRLTPFGAVEISMVALMGVMVLDLMTRSGRPTSDALQSFDEQITPILLFLAARNLCVRRSDVRAAAGILAVVGCYLALHGGFQYFGLGSTNPTTEVAVQQAAHEGGMRVDESHLGEGRAVGPFVSAVEFGSVAAITLIAALYVGLYLTHGAARYLSLAAAPLIGAAVLFSSTRSVWVGAYMGLALMAVLDRDRRARMLTALGLVTAAVVVVVMIPASSFLRERAASTEPISGRFLMYEVGLRVAARRPLIGYGRGTPARVAARRELLALGDPDADLAPGQFHNIYLSILVEWGIVGLAAYVAMLALIVKGALELRRRLAERRDFVYHFAGFFLCTALIFIVQGLFVDSPMYFYLNGVFSFLAGLVFAQLDATAPNRQTVVEAAYLPVSLNRSANEAS